MYCLKLCVTVSEPCLGTVLKPSFQETDKATIDVEAQDEGILGKILVRPSHSRCLCTPTYPPSVFRLRMVPRMCPWAKLLLCSLKRGTISRIFNPLLRKQNQNHPSNPLQRKLQPQRPSQPQLPPHPLLPIRTSTSSPLGRYSHPFFGCFRNTTLTRWTKLREPGFAGCSLKGISSLTWVLLRVPPVHSRRNRVWTNTRPNRNRKWRRLNPHLMDLRSDGLSCQICLPLLLVLALVQVTSFLRAHRDRLA